MGKRKLQLSKVYGLLETGPTVMLTTACRGRDNIMVMSWHTMMEFDPPMLGCVVSDRNFSFELLKSGRTCGINIPTLDMAEKLVGCGNVSGVDVDKFERFSLTRMSAVQIEAPLVAECFANLECRVVDTTMVKKYCFFVLEVVNARIDPKVINPQTLHHEGYGKFMIAGERIQLKSAMR